MELKDKRNILSIMFPEVQVYRCINDLGFIQNSKSIKEGKVYVYNNGNLVKNKSNLSDRSYGSDIVIYIYLFFLSLLSLLVLFSPIYFALDIRNLLIKGAFDNTCMTMFYEVGLAAGLAMLVPHLRKIYYIVPWMYTFITVTCFDLIIMGLSISMLKFVLEYNILSLFIMFTFFLILRIVMCVFFKNYTYYSQKSFKIFGGIIFIVGVLGIIFL